MREWQVGDPVGDGNDIGVPDTRYMGYLKDDESYEDEIADDFKFHLNHARDYYNMEKYEDAFFYLNSAFKIYSKMNGSQKSQVRKDPFNQYWILDLCCKTANNHGKYQRESIFLIIKNGLDAKICKDCDWLYPYDYTFCIKCGKPVSDIIGNSREKFTEKLNGILKNKIWNDFERTTIISRAWVLTESNGCRLVDVSPSSYGLDFTFEKQHRYFTTRYVCEYVPGSVRFFEDFGSCHYHDRLLEDERFKKLISESEKRTGFKFMECSGGYGAELDENHIDFIFNDEISVFVRFDIGDSRTAVYKLDLNNMKLSDEYDIY